MRKFLREYLPLLAPAAVVVALDQGTKSWIRANLPFESTWLPDGFGWLEPYARIVHWHNRGAAFGMFQQASMVFTVLAIIVIAAILYYFPKVEKRDRTVRIAMGLQLGGAAGNLVDRLTIGTVTDFISVGTFPVFNVADSAITAGVAVLLLGLWLQDRRAARTAAGKGQPNAARPGT